MKTRTRAGVSFLEILFASLLMAVLGLPVLQVLMTGTGEAMASEDYIEAEMIASRLLETELARRFEDLEKKCPLAESFDVSVRPASAEVVTRPALGAAAQGSDYRVTLKIEEIEPGLVRLEVPVRWTYHGKERRFVLMRIRARPNLSAGGRLL